MSQPQTSGDYSVDAILQGLNINYDENSPAPQPAAQPGVRAAQPGVRAAQPGVRSTPAAQPGVRSTPAPQSVYDPQMVAPVNVIPTADELSGIKLPGINCEPIQSVEAPIEAPVEMVMPTAEVSFGYTTPSKAELPTIEVAEDKEFNKVLEETLTVAEAKVDNATKADVVIKEVNKSMDDLMIENLSSKAKSKKSVKADVEVKAEIDIAEELKDVEPKAKKIKAPDINAALEVKLANVPNVIKEYNDSISELTLKTSSEFESSNNLTKDIDDIYGMLSSDERILDVLANEHIRYLKDILKNIEQSIKNCIAEKEHTLKSFRRTAQLNIKKVCKESISNNTANKAKMEKALEQMVSQFKESYIGE